MASKTDLERFAELFDSVDLEFQMLTPGSTPNGQYIISIVLGENEIVFGFDKAWKYVEVGVQTIDEGMLREREIRRDPTEE